MTHLLPLIGDFFSGEWLRNPPPARDLHTKRRTGGTVMNHKIKDVMTRNVQVISPTSSIQEAAQRMKELDIGVLPVCDGDRLLGTVTDRDIVVRALAQETNSNGKTVRDVMTSPIVFCFEDQDIEDVARIMEVKQIRRLPVLNRERRLVGIASLGDIAVRGGQEELIGEILEKVCEPIQSNPAA